MTSILAGHRRPLTVPASWVCAYAGSGRTSVLSALRRRAAVCCQAHVIHLRCLALAGAPLAAVIKVLQDAALEALDCSPALVVLDDLDALCPVAQSGPEINALQADASNSERLAHWLTDVLDHLRDQGVRPLA